MMPLESLWSIFPEACLEYQKNQSKRALSDVYEIPKWGTKVEYRRGGQEI